MSDDLRRLASVKGGEAKREKAKRAEDQLRLAGIAIEERPASEAKEFLTFLPKVLVLTGMPHRDPGNIDIWERANGDVTFFMTPGFAYDPGQRKMVRLPLPSGVHPRLINQFITTSVVRTGSRRVYLGESFREFEHLLGVKHGGTTSLQLHRQSRALFAASLGWAGRLGHAELGQEVKLVEGRALFWDVNRPDQRSMWTSYIDLSPTYFEQTLKHCVPMDERAYNALAQRGSSLAMDILGWLSFKTYSLRERSPLLTWRALMGQFGSEYAQPKDFAVAFRKALALVRGVYRGARVEVQRRGIVLHPSKTLVPRKAAVLRFPPPTIDAQ